MRCLALEMTNNVLCVRFMPKLLLLFFFPPTEHIFITPILLENWKQTWRKISQSAVFNTMDVIFFFYWSLGWDYISSMRVESFKYLENCSNWMHITQHSTETANNKFHFPVFLGKTFRWQMVITRRWREGFIIQTGLKVI